MKGVFPIKTFLTAAFLLAPFFIRANVVINEVAWMGTAVSANDEWIEIYNNGAMDVDLSGWVLTAADGAPDINFSSAANKIIPAGGFFLLERTDDTTVPNIAADLIYAGALSNDGEILILKNESGAEVDRVGAQDSWPAGDNVTKQTMQRLANGNWITATATPKSINAAESQSSSSQSSVLPAGQAGSSSSSISQYSSQGQSVSDSGSVYVWPVEPRIYANAGTDKTAIAGADALFEGKALGIKKEPLDGARYLWNFGDGSSAEGKNVRHSYKYPGTHIAVLDVSSGQYSASDRLNVKVIPNDLYIADASGEFIRLKNKSNIVLDISGWFLMGGGVIFKFPASSFVAAGAELTIPADVSKIKFSEGSNIDLLYSNGSVAFSYKKEIAPSSAVAVFKPTVPAKIEKGLANSSSSGNFSSSSLPLSQTNNQAANVIYTAKTESSSWKIWLYLAVFLGIFGGGGLFFIRRNGGA